MGDDPFQLLCGFAHQYRIQSKWRIASKGFEKSERLLFQSRRQAFLLSYQLGFFSLQSELASRLQRRIEPLERIAGFGDLILDALAI